VTAKDNLNTATCSTAPQFLVKCSSNFKKVKKIKKNKIPKKSSLSDLVAIISNFVNKEIASFSNFLIS